MNKFEETVKLIHHNPYCIGIKFTSPLSRTFLRYAYPFEIYWKINENKKWKNKKKMLYPLHWTETIFNREDHELKPIRNSNDYDTQLKNILYYFSIYLHNTAHNNIQLSSLRSVALVCFFFFLIQNGIPIY